MCMQSMSIILCVHIRGAAHHDPLNNCREFLVPLQSVMKPPTSLYLYIHALFKSTKRMYIIHYNLQAAVDKRVVRFVYWFKNEKKTDSSLAARDRVIIHIVHCYISYSSLTQCVPTYIIFLLFRLNEEDVRTRFRLCVMYTQWLNCMTRHDNYYCSTYIVI